MFGWLRRAFGSVMSNDLRQLDENEKYLYGRLERINVALVNLKVRINGIENKHTREECLDIVNNLIYPSLTAALATVRKSHKITLREEKLEGEKRKMVRELVADLQELSVAIRMSNPKLADLCNRDIEFLEKEIGL